MVNFPTSLDTYTTHAAAQVITSADINKIQDTLTALEAKVGVDSSAVTTSLDYKVNHPTAMTYCFLNGGGSQTITTSSLTAITGTVWTVEEADAGAWHSTVSNTSRITVPSAGLYMVHAQLYWTGGAGAAGGRETIIYKNGAYFKGSHIEAIATKDVAIGVTATIALAANDYIEIFAYQTSGGSISVGGNVNYNWFQVTRLSS